MTNHLGRRTKARISCDRVEGAKAGAGFDGFGDVDDVGAGRVEGDGKGVAGLEDFEFAFAVKRDGAGRGVEFD
jgi:hypothetical protein